MPLFFPVIALSGVMAGHEIIKYLSGFTTPLTFNKVLVINIESSAINAVSIPRYRYCSNCGERGK
jgi:hypothetical protein